MLDSCCCWRCTLRPCKVRNIFLVNFWNRTILLCIPCINISVFHDMLLYELIQVRTFQRSMLPPSSGQCKKVSPSAPLSEPHNSQVQMKWPWDGPHKYRGSQFIIPRLISGQQVMSLLWTICLHDTVLYFLQLRKCPTLGRAGWHIPLSFTQRAQQMGRRRNPIRFD